MKRIAVFLAAVLLAFGLIACKDNGDESNTGVTISKTQSFYASVSDPYYVELEMTEGDTTYRMTQVKKGKTTTTIKDYEDDSQDIYCIFDGSRIDYLDLDTKTVDTTLSTNGQVFLFEGSSDRFANPTVNENAQFRGKTYRCESFATASTSNGAVDGEDRYYFEANVLRAVEIVTNGEVTMTLVLLDYGSGVPDGVFTSVPDDYSKGNLNFDTTVDTSGWWD